MSSLLELSSLIFGVLVVVLSIIVFCSVFSVFVSFCVADPPPPPPLDGVSLPGIGIQMSSQVSSPGVGSGVGQGGTGEPFCIFSIVRTSGTSQ